MTHVTVPLKVLYFGTPVVLIGTRGPDGTPNIAPMSSAWWLDQCCMLGMSDASATARNMRREGECVLNLPSSALVAAVDRIALTTGVPTLTERRKARGYRYEPDKFAAAGLTPQASELVAAPRIQECPIQMECVVESIQPFADTGATAFGVRVLRTHVAPELLVPGKNYVDPVGWDPLIMKFCEFFGGGQNLQASRLAAGWQMAHPSVPTADGVLLPAGVIDPDLDADEDADDVLAVCAS